MKASNRVLRCIFFIVGVFALGTVHGQVSDAQRNELRRNYSEIYLKGDLSQDSLAKVQLWIDEELSSVTDATSLQRKLEFIAYQRELVNIDPNNKNPQANRARAGDDQNAIELTNGIGVLGRNIGSKITLRWAPQNATLWLKAISTGYSIHRYELNERNFIKSETKVQVVTMEQPIMPWDSTGFANFEDRNDSMVMLAAQAMYGSSFKVTSDQEEVTNFYGRATEFENRFGFALFAADRSENAASALGLVYEDENIEAGKNYAYFLSVHEGGELIGSGYGEVMASEAADNEEAILGLEIEARDQAVDIIWTRYQTGNYTAYFIEKSEDGGSTYFPLNKTPKVFAESDAAYKRGLIIFQDSVEQNYKEYFYRVRALTPFADFSEYSVVSGMGRDLTPPRNPAISNFRVLEGQRIELNWTKEEIESDMLGYYIYQSDDHGGVYTKLFEEPLPSASVQYTTDGLDETETHYYKVSAIDTAGNESESFPLFANLPDNNPPSMPKDVIYTIDSFGVVTLGWTLGSEKDLSGYRVYFSNDLQNEFSQITVSPIDHNYFVDTIQLKTLTEDLYYSIQAVDKRHNRSPLSEPILVKRPDIVPPVTPVFDHPEISDSTIMLKWHPSSSEDVESHLLFRRKNITDEAWELIATLGNVADSYSDADLIPEQVYEYALQAQDDDGLLSELSFPVKGRIYFTDQIVSAENVNAVFDEETKNVTVEWTYTAPSEGILVGLNHRFNIYRSSAGAPFKKIKQITGNTYTDIDTPEEGTCSYAVQVIFENGKKSGRSESEEVTIPEIK